MINGISESTVALSSAVDEQVCAVQEIAAAAHEASSELTLSAASMAEAGQAAIKTHNTGLEIRKLAASLADAATQLDARTNNFFDRVRQRGLKRPQSHSACLPGRMVTGSSPRQERSRFQSAAKDFGMTTLEALGRLSIIVADTGDLDAMRG